MKASIAIDPVTNVMTITIHELNWGEIQGLSFYKGEVTIRDLTNMIAQELTLDLMRTHLVDDPWLILNGETYYRKEASLGHYQTLFGQVSLSRHLYQTSAGGPTICPLEVNCQMRFGSATPMLAEVASFKLASATPGEVETDLAKSHGLKLSDTYLREIGQQVGQIAIEKRIKWKAPIAEQTAPVETVASGVDGTTMPLVGEDYKEAMCGTIALYSNDEDEEGKRLTTEYHGAMPEAGKTGFATNFAARVTQVLMQFPMALHVCLGDGAKWNWEFFQSHFPDATMILDFFHALLHLHKVAELIFSAGEQAEAYYEQWQTKLLEEDGAISGLLRSLLRYRNQTGLPARIRNALDTEINYFRENADRMHYAEYLAQGFPIGSGVTEAACKELIKARFCRSGMRWKRESGAPILQLRAIKLSKQWESFWADVMRRAA
jgi:hypothetical protein